MKNQLIKKAAYLLFLLVIPLCAIIYEKLNHPTQNPVDISTSLDHFIPFLPIFIIPYGLWYEYLFFYLVYFCFKDPKVYLKTLSIIVVGEIICFIIFHFFQTTVPRPTVEGNRLLNRFVLMVYAYDRPYNCFPSIHVLTCCALMLGSLQIKNKHLAITLCTHIGGGLIIISTLFVKQHVIFDVMGSLLLVTLLYGIWFEVISFRIPNKSKTMYLGND